MTERAWRRALFILWAFLSLSGGAASSSAQQVEAFTGETLDQACKNLVLALRGVQPLSQEDPGAMLCLGYIAGWSQAMELVEPKPFCWPLEAKVMPGDVAELIVAYVETHPEASAQPAHAAVQNALEDAFPCPESSESEPAERGPPG